MLVSRVRRKIEADFEGSQDHRDGAGRRLQVHAHAADRAADCGAGGTGTGAARSCGPGACGDAVSERCSRLGGAIAAALQCGGAIHPAQPAGWLRQSMGCVGRRSVPSIAVIVATVWTTTRQTETDLGSDREIRCRRHPHDRRRPGDSPLVSGAAGLQGRRDFRLRGGRRIRGDQPGSSDGEALERCKARTDLSTSGPCGLYAVGMDVVWSPKSIPMPLPGDFHDESLGVPLRTVDMPLWNDSTRRTIDSVYVAKDDHRALAMAGQNGETSFWSADLGATAEGSRRLVEKCGHLHQVPCLLVSVDGMLTVRIPKSRRVTGLFMVTTEPQMSAADRQRIDEVYRQKEWRALARGKSGGWYPVANALSEDAAVTDALSACSRSDSDCKLYAIGNFRTADGN